MLLSFRMLIIAVVIMGLGLGVAFGAGIAYGRGDPKTVQSGLTQAQIQSLLGITGNTGAAGATGGTGGAGTQDTTGATGTPTAQRGGANNGAGTGTTGGNAGAAAAAAARATTGRITAVQGQTITIDTRTGAQKVNIGSTTTISKLSAGAMTDLKEGATILASGARNSDGSFDATDIAQVPADLTTLIAGTTGTGGAAASATPASGR